MLTLLCGGWKKFLTKCKTVNKSQHVNHITIYRINKWVDFQIRIEFNVSMGSHNLAGILYWLTQIANKSQTKFCHFPRLLMLLHLISNSMGLISLKIACTHLARHESNISRFLSQKKFRTLLCGRIILLGMCC